MTQNIKPIIIVGSGIIGLSVLYRLLEDIDQKNSTNVAYNIQVITSIDEKVLASNNTTDEVLFDQDIASVYAGAHQRPFPTEYTNGDERLTYQRRESLYTKETFNYFLNKLKKSKQWDYDSFDTSIKLCRGYDLIQSANKAYWSLNDGYNSHNLVNFIKHDQALDDSIVPKSIQENLDMICSYDTYVVNTPRFLRFLYKSCISKSKSLPNTKLTFHFNQKVRFLEDVTTFSSDPRLLIVNCSGKGNIPWNKNDATIESNYVPIRGQTLLISVPNTPVYQKYAENTVTYQNGSKWSFIIHRPLPKAHKDFKKRLYFIIGGTKQYGSYDKNISNDDLTYVLNNAKEIFPNLFVDGEWILERVNVGFRPGSKTGSVVNIEHKASFNKTNYYPVVNCYGFAGYGVECSFGAAGHALSLMRRAFREANL